MLILLTDGNSSISSAMTGIPLSILESVENPALTTIRTEKAPVIPFGIAVAK
jgi:hypothetical protein